MTQNLVVGQSDEESISIHDMMSTKNEGDDTQIELQQLMSQKLTSNSKMDLELMTHVNELLDVDRIFIAT